MLKIIGVVAALTGDPRQPAGSYEFVSKLLEVHIRLVGEAVRSATWDSPYLYWIDTGPEAWYRQQDPR